MISFEPVKECHEALLKRSKKTENWIVADQSAIGDKDETAMINVSDDTVFSSLLEIKDWHADLKSKSKTVKQEEIQVNKLNTVIDKYIPNKSEQRILLKIDTQGYEKEVLAGASDIMKYVVGLKIEIPLTPIYEKIGFSFYEMIDYLKENGFEPYSFNNEGVNLKTGRVNTIDGFFIRTGK